MRHLKHDRQSQARQEMHEQKARHYLQKRKSLATRTGLSGKIAAQKLLSVA
jgi:hypothetical protein